MTFGWYLHSIVTYYVCMYFPLFCNSSDKKWHFSIMQQPLAHVCFLMWKGNIWFIMMAMTVLHHQKCIRCNACTIWLYPIICICSCCCQASSMMAHFVWKENHDHYWSNNNVDIWQWKMWYSVLAKYINKAVLGILHISRFYLQ